MSSPPWPCPPPTTSPCCAAFSAEPCAMCAGSLYWAGIGRLVHAMSEHRLKRIIGPHPDKLTLDLPCRTVFASGQREVEMIGPLLEDDPEGAALHDGVWERH